MKYFASFFQKLRAQQGATLIEVLVAIGLTAVLLPALATGMSAAREGRAQDSERLKATALLREAEEAVRSVREKGWSNVATNGTYRPSISGSTWSLTAGAETVSGFTRQVVISDAQRNSNGDIVASGGTADPSTKKVVTTVSWTTPLASSISNEIYLSRFNGNESASQTSAADFSDGTLVNTVVTNTAGGEVQLGGGSGGPVDWSSPTEIGHVESTYDANDIWTDGTYAYVADNSYLQIFNVSDKTNPTFLGRYNANTTVNGVFVSGNYAYIATVSDTQEFMIINVTNKASPTLTRTLNLGDAQNAESVTVSGNYAYVGKRSSTTSGQNEFYIINATTPASASINGSFNIAGNVNGIVVNGNYAYLATTEAAAEFRVMNITNKASPTSAGVRNLTGSLSGSDIAAVGTTAYLTTLGNATYPELHVINAATPASPTLLGTYNNGTSTSSSFTGVSIAGNYAFLSGISEPTQLTVLNITTPATPTLVGTAGFGDNAFEVFALGDYAYLVGQTDYEELTIYTGASSGGFATTGTYESGTFDAGANVGFNYHTMNITEPAGTDIRFQVATNNNNSTWNFVGPDGTAATYFEASGGVPLNAVSARYWRYRVYFTGDGTATPVLLDVQTNYSP